MDDIVLRPRYPRHKTHKRRRKNYRNSMDFSQKIAQQVVVCLIILGIAGIIKYVNMPFTNYLSEKVTAAISQNIEIKGLYENVDGFIKALTDSDNKKDTDIPDINEATLPASTQNDFYTEEEYHATDTATENKQQTDLQDTNANERISSTETRTSRSGESIGEKVSLPLNVNLIPPVAGLVGSSFGERIHPIKKTAIFHEGVDIEANKGEPIKAVLGGEVFEAGSEKTLGNYIKIRHTAGWSSVYAHCSVLTAKKGQKVKQGDIIAKVGNTGASVGAHLHFELRKDGKPVDPQQYIDIASKD
ncbi:MAG: M23 family metallopeptidase [Clostridia bacterium]|nr:M23 family metallopeptidase [Clostridia bacterium]